jgi:hypothetical protein
MIIGALKPEAYRGAPFGLQPVRSPAQLSLKGSGVRSGEMHSSDRLAVSM